MSYKDPQKQKEAQHRHYLKNKKQYRERSKNAKRKQQIIYESFKELIHCEYCGEDYPRCLDFHHIDPTQKEYEVSWITSSIHKGWSTALKEMKKCIVVCKNCHAKVHDCVLECLEKSKFNHDELSQIAMTNAEQFIKIGK